MTRRRRISIALISTAALVGPVAEASATTRYAAPHRFSKLPGAAPCIDPAKPCTLVTALAQAATGDDVQLAPGNYWKSALLNLGTGKFDPYDDALAVPTGVTRVTIHGADPTSLPVIHVAPNSQAESGVDVPERGKIHDVAIDGTAKDDTPIAYSLSLSQDAVAERVRVETDAAVGALLISCSMADGAALRSSLCLGRGEPGKGKVTAVNAATRTASFSVRNVTAITTAPDSVGLNFGTSNGVASIVVSNSIFRGPAADLHVRAGISGGTATANVDHSNWVSQDVSAVGGASAVLVNAGGNQNAATAVEPIFVNAAVGDYREAPTSPTIDAGVVDSANNGTLAFGGDHRFIGKTTDIGAHEFDPAKVVPPTTPTSPTTPTTPTTPAPTTPTPSPDVSGGPQAPQSTVVPDRVAPKLSGLKLAKRVKRSKGTTITFTLSEPATVQLAFGQPSAGRSVGGTCVKQTAKNRKRPKCTLPGVKGTQAVAGRSGINTVAFRGTVGAGKKLALGKYTLTARATDPAGNVAAAATRRLTLTR